MATQGFVSVAPSRIFELDGRAARFRYRTAASAHDIEPLTLPADEQQPLRGWSRRCLRLIASAYYGPRRTTGMYEYEA
jgi:hypothetical protein